MSLLKPWRYPGERGACHRNNRKEGEEGKEGEEEEEGEEGEEGEREEGEEGEEEGDRDGDGERPMHPWRIHGVDHPEIHIAFYSTPAPCLLNVIRTHRLHSAYPSGFGVWQR